jgi:transposase-like protein
MAKRRRRDLAREAVWRRRLNQQANSEQSVRAWCRRHRVTETAFYWWRRELARRDAGRKPSARGETRAQAHSFVPVQVIDPAARDGEQQIEIVLTDGRRVRVAGPVNREMLADVLDMLEHRAC